MHQGRTRALAARRWLLVASGLVVVVMASVLLPATRAVAQTPVLGPSRITFDEPIDQGEDLRLPSLNLGNRGERATEFTFDVTFFINVEEMPLNPAWFAFDPQRVVLNPGESREIRVRMRLPKEATPGDYRGLLRAYPVATGGGAGGVSVTAAVATTLTFTIRDKDFHWYDPLTNFYADGSPFTYVGTAVILLVIVGVLAQRRLDLHFDVGVRRGRRDDDGRDGSRRDDGRRVDDRDVRERDPSDGDQE